jgi:hypothetical protein
MSKSTGSSVQEPSTLEVHRTRLYKRKVVEESAEQEILQVTPFSVEPAKVGVEFGVTVNMGNFESVKIAVRVEVPCYREEVEDVYKQASSFVEDKCRDEVLSVKSVLKTPF